MGNATGAVPPLYYNLPTQSAAPAAQRRQASRGQASAPCHLAVEETTNQRCHLIELVFEREMSRVEDMKLRRGKIAKIRMRALLGKYLVVLAPDDQRRRLALAEELLKLRIERHVGPVVIEQVELNVFIARPIQQRLIVNPVVRADARQILDSI